MIFFYRKHAGIKKNYLKVQHEGHEIDLKQTISIL